MKRFVALLLCTLTVLSLLPLSVLADSPVITYEWDDDGKRCVATKKEEGKPDVVEEATVLNEQIKSIVQTPATCIAKGTTRYTATFTGSDFAVQQKDVKDISVDSANHTKAEHHVAQAATCSATGCNEYWECEDCGKLFTNATCTTETTLADVTLAIVPAAHKLNHVDAKAATCSAEGNNEYWQCEYCKKYFSNSAATTETTLADVTLAIVPAAHKLNHVDAKAATCSAEGNAEYWQCEYCKKYYSDAAATTETTLADVTLAVVPAAHKLNHVAAKAAQCETDGNKEYWQCEYCNKYYSDAAATTETTAEDVVISKTGHLNVNYIKPTLPTCATDGTKDYWECEDCHTYFADEKQTQKLTSIPVNPKLNHTNPETGKTLVEAHERIEPTYYQKGLEAYWYCPECKQYYADAACTTPISGPVIIDYAKLGVPTLKCTAENGSVKMESSYVADATGYAVYRYEKSKGVEATKELGAMTERTHTDTTAKYGVEYGYFIRAFVTDGEQSAYSDASNTIFVTLLPSQVTGVTASASETTVTVTWTAVENATGYEVYYTEDQTLPDSSYTLAGTVASGTTVTFQKSGLTPGHIYYFKIRACINDNSVKTYGDFSSPATAVTVPLATPVVTLTKVDAGTVKVAWKEVPGAEQYVIDVTGAKNSTKTVAAPALEASFELPPKGAYSFTVYAYSEVSGDKIRSATCAAKTVTLSLDAPILTATKASVNSISVSWTKVDGADAYWLYTYDSASSAYKLVSKQSGRSITITAAPGKLYYYTVRAVSHKGDVETVSDYSGVRCVSLVATTPVITATKTGVTQITVKWAKLEYAIGYRLYRKTAEDTKYELYKKESDLTATTVSFTDSTAAGTTYSYKLVAVYQTTPDEIVSSESGVKSVTLPMVAPTVAAKKLNAKQVKLTWKSVAGATAYRVYVTNVKNGTYEVAKTLTATDPALKNYAYTYTALPGKTYYFRVTAVSKIGSGIERESKYSAVKSVALAFAAPALTVKKGSGSSVTVTWKAISGADKYRLFIKEGSDGVFIEKKEFASSDARTYTTDVLPGMTYYFKMVSVAEVGGNEAVSTFSAVKNIKLAFAAPALTVKKVSATDIQLTWKKVVVADSYRVYYKLSTDSDYTQFGSDIPAGTLTATFSGLPGKSYSFKVVGVKTVGSKESVGTASVKTIKLPFAAPVVTVKRDTSNAIILKWGAVTPATGYIVEVSTDNTFATRDTYNCATTALQLDGYPAAKYYIRVKAVYQTKAESTYSKTKYITLK